MAPESGPVSSFAFQLVDFFTGLDQIAPQQPEQTAGQDQLMHQARGAAGVADEEPPGVQHSHSLASGPAQVTLVGLDIFRYHHSLPSRNDTS